MPWRLSRYLLGDLIVQIFVTTAILVTVVAFGAVIKPLADDSVLSAGQAMTFIALAIVPMLQYAIPFAAGFAGTLCLNRMARDNEILAMSVSGFSYQRILAPVLGLGVLLTIVMIVLTQIVAPIFNGMMARTIAGEGASMIRHAIDRGVPFEYQGLQLWAEHAFIEDDPQTGANTRLVLQKMAAAQVDSSGQIISDVTASTAILDLYEVEGGTYLKLLMLDAISHDARSGDLRGFPRFEPAQAIPIPGGEWENPRAMTIWRLRRFAEDPAMYPPVDLARRKLAQALDASALHEVLSAEMAKTGAVELTGRGADEPVTIRVTADVFDRGRMTNSDGTPCEVSVSGSAGSTRHFSCGGASIRRAQLAGLQGRSLDLVLQDAHVEVGGVVNRRGEIIIGDLEPVGLALPDSSELDLASAIEAGRADAGSSPMIKIQLRETLAKVDQIKLESQARIARRYATSATVALLLLLGAVAALLFRNAQPLNIYLLAFIPALFDLLLVNSGGHLIRGGDMVTGYAVMWSGNGLVVVLIVLLLTRLQRH
jgi:lipopolysaccharide export LptBFGC system permease protein LptF